MQDRDLITIGKITKNQGNKGEVRVIPLTDHPERFQFVESVFLKKEEILLKKMVQSLRYHKKYVILKLEGVGDIGKALELKDFYIQIPRSDMIPLEDGQYYIDDIIGYKAITTDGEKIGILMEIITTGGTDVFVVQGKEKQFMIPAAREMIVDIDEDSGQIIIDPIPGLFDL